MLRLSLRACLGLAALLGCHSASSAAERSPCRHEAFEQQTYTVCVADPAKTNFKLFLNRDDGTAYGALDAVPQDKLEFATNAGMFTPEYAPAGLYIENGVAKHVLNTHASGYGNFHLQPNGVFWIKDGTAHVTTTADYARLKPAADIATQSGPMLLIGGSINPKFDANGQSRYVRNGIGVTAGGEVVVAISEEPVSFGAFARLFRDDLKCADALYLDGSVSRLLVPGDARNTAGPKLGPILGVYAR